MQEVCHCINGCCRNKYQLAGNVFVNNALSTSHTLSVAGGSEKTSYYMSLNYGESRGIIRSNKNTAYRIRANMETQANAWLKISNNLSVSRQNDFDQQNSNNGLSGAIVGAIRALPNVPIYSTTHPTGYNIAPMQMHWAQALTCDTIDDNYTNIAFVLDNNKFQSDKYRILNTTFIELTLAKGLTSHHQIGCRLFY